MHLMAKNKKAAKAASVDKKIIRQSAKEMFENHKGGIIAIAVLAVVIIALDERVVQRIVLHGIDAV